MKVKYFYQNYLEILKGKQNVVYERPQKICFFCLCFARDSLTSWAELAMESTTFTCAPLVWMKHNDKFLSAKILPRSKILQIFIIKLYCFEFNEFYVFKIGISSLKVLFWIVRF